MFDLFENFKKGILSCQKSGVCAASPVLNALNAVVINEVRQIAFYMVKLKEFNITNQEILKEAVCALSINITDVEFDKNAFKNFYLKLKKTTEKTADFYINKCKEMNIAYESIHPAFNKEAENFNITNLIKMGESLIRQHNSNSTPEKTALIEVIIAISKCASIQLFKLSNFIEPDINYSFEILRLMALTNNVHTREEKLTRRIKEFSNTLYEINKELSKEREKHWGKRVSGSISTSIETGKSILVTGGGLEELYELLSQTEGKNINVYADISLVTAFSYPKIKAFKHFKGLYGLSQFELDFSNFKGVIFVTSNSNKQLGNIFRGKIYTTKKIPFDRAIKINICDLTNLIEGALETEGFEKNKKGDNIEFDFNMKTYNDFIENIKEDEIFLTAGLKDEAAEEKFKNAAKIDFFPPDETEILYNVIEKSLKEKLTVYFSICTKESINTILSILDKGLKNIYITECQAFNINPHVIEALKKEFNVKEI